MSDSFWQRRVARPLVLLLRQGVTPDKLALSLALSVTLSVIPAIGWSAILCAIFAVIFRLNLPVMQAVNYFFYPVQLALLLPFFRLGEKLFRAPHLPLSVSQIYAAIHHNIWGAIRFLWSTTWHAVVVWAILAPLSVALIHYTLLPIFRRIARRQPSEPLPVPEAKAVS